MIAHVKEERTIESPAEPLFSDVAVVALVADRWDRAWQSRHQVLSRLAAYFHVIWCDEADEWRETLASRKPVTGGAPYNLTVFQPGVAESKFYRPGILARYAERRRYRKPIQMAQALGAKKIILYIWRPKFASALQLAAYDKAVYHIDDEYSFSKTDQGINPVERTVMETVDQVFIHSPALMEKKGHINPNTARVPNGVDFAAFSTLQEEPEDLADIPHPRIGYVGYLKSQLNFGLLNELAGKRPDWSFVFIGPTGVLHDQQEAFDSLMSRPNAHKLGPKPKENLPAYVQHVDVCSMGYNVDDYTKYIYPLKVHEYFAAGKPVVATPIRSLLAFDDLLELEEAADGWEAAIERCLAEPSEGEKTEKRRDLARRHDWNRIVGEIAGHFCKLLGEGYSARLKDAENQNKS